MPIVVAVGGDRLLGKLNQMRATGQDRYRYFISFFSLIHPLEFFLVSNIVIVRFKHFTFYNYKPINFKGVV